MMSDPTDIELVRAVLAGDERAAFALDARWRPLIEVFARKRSLDHDNAEDIAQLVLIRVFANLSRFRQDARFGTWVFTIASNVMITYSRSSYARRRDAEANLDALYDDRSAADRSVLDGETRDRIRNALGKLKLRQREALMMACDEDRPYEEIASLTGAKLGCVKSRINRARHAFAAAYG